MQVELAEAAEGLTKTSGPARKHVRSCDGCARPSATSSAPTARRSPRSSRSAPLAFIKGGLLSKLFGGGAAGTGGAAAGGGAVGAVGGVCRRRRPVRRDRPARRRDRLEGRGRRRTAALITAGAVEVRNLNDGDGVPVEGPEPAAAMSAPVASAAHEPPAHNGFVAVQSDDPAPQLARATATAPVVEEPAAAPVPEEEVAPVEEEEPAPVEGSAPVEETQGGVVIGTEPGEGAVVPPETGGAPTDPTLPTDPAAPAPEPTPPPVVPPTTTEPPPSGEPAPETEPPAEPAVPLLP